jgi:3-hydroxyacyl-[acyl-carrier-protein] dehydratase
MPPALLFDYIRLDLNKVEFDHSVISQVNPQAYEMSQLDAIVWHDLPQMLCLGYKDVTEKEFWCRGHIPGRPIMPGVIMVESAAQLCSFFMRRIYGLKEFIGLQALVEPFRETVVPIGCICWNISARSQPAVLRDSQSSMISWLSKPPSAG